MAVGFVGKFLRAIRISKAIADIRKSPNLSPSPLNLYSSSSVSEENEIPSPPKKPLSPYMLFIQEKRPEMFGSSSNVKLTEQVRLLAGKWRTMSEIEREEYREKYKKNLAEYVKVNESYLKSLTREQYEALLERFRLRKDQIHKRQVKAQLRKLNKPVGVRNAFSFFVSNETAMSSGKLNAVEAIKEISSRWKTLPKEEKERYQKMAEDDKIRYRAEITSWTKKMIEEGHSNLLEEVNKKKTQKEKKS